MFGIVNFFKSKKQAKGNFELDENGRALIEIGVSDKSHIVAPFHHQQRQTISGEFASLLENNAKATSPKQPLHIKMDCPNLSDEEKQVYATAIKTYFRNKEQEMEWKLGEHYKSFLICLLFSIFFCALWVLCTELNAYWFVSDLIEILVWMFVLESADILVFKRKLVLLDKKQYHSLANSKVSYTKEGGNMNQIAIDGHSGSGKSAFAKGIAKALGYYHLNTGDIYRALACAYKERGFGDVTEHTIAEFIQNIKVEVIFENDKQIVYVDGKEYTSSLNLEETSILASKVSPFKNLRAKVLNVQRDFASKNNVVMEGRDIGSVVLPNAQVKIFLTANVKARAERRYKELSPEDKAKTSLEEVMEELQQRDYRDEHREVAPLIVAQGAVVLDNSNINLEQTIEQGLMIVRNKIKA